MRNLHGLLVLGICVLVTSCNDFLNVNPDERTTLDSPEKVRQILLAAYPTSSGDLAMEWSSDNVVDNGQKYSNPKHQISQIYQWTQDTSIDNDSPTAFWEGCYLAIANANQALEALDKFDINTRTNAMRGEALICRAFAHFLLSQNFCLAYNPETASTDLGLPYMTHTETTVAPKYSRGTMQELYANINKDIEGALPLINDNLYPVPTYHFNQKAAYAFAARFNLYYTNYKKAISYASQALGSTPNTVLRDWSSWASGPVSAEVLWNAYIDADLSNNLMFLVPQSNLARYVTYLGECERYAHSLALANQVGLEHAFIWGNYSTLIKAKYTTSSNQQVAYFCVPEKIEYTDKSAGIGYAHTVLVPFTTNKVLLERAEAYALDNQLDKAVEDINLWMYSSISTHPQYTKEDLVSYMNTLETTKFPASSIADFAIKNTLHPQGFIVQDGDQEELIQLILHLKRIETIHEGGRWMDIKRYGIEVTHLQVDMPNTPLTLAVGDPRRALQLPADVLSAGLEKNPE